MQLAANYGRRESMKKCAFCTKWYDPTNQHIRPKNKSYWEYDDKAESMCLRTSTKRKGYQYCPYFECKI